MTDPSIFSQVKADADQLYNDLVKEHNRVLDALPKVTKVEADKSLYVARKFLFDSGKLCGEVLWALGHRRVHLGLIGTKTLVEIEIFTKYIFLHQQIKSDSSWAQRMATVYIDEYGRGQNDHFNNKSVAKLARAVDLPERLETYRGLCKMAHPTIHTRHVVVGTDETLDDFAIDTYVAALATAHNVRSYIETFFKIEPNKEFEEKIVQFRDKYPNRVK